MLGSSSSSADSSEGWYSISCQRGAIPESGGGVRVCRTAGSIVVGAGSKTKEFSGLWVMYSVFGVKIGSLDSQSSELIDIGLRFEPFDAGESLNLGVMKEKPLVGCPFGEAKSFHGEPPF